MRYFKYTSEKALNAWHDNIAARKALYEEALKFCARFGGKPVFSNTAMDFHFHDISFSDKPHHCPELWTKPVDHGACHPRKRVPASLRQLSKDLHREWGVHRPRQRVSNDAVFDALGLDWGMVIITGLAWFEHDDVIWVGTGAIPAESARAIEVTDGEYTAAERACQEARHAATV